MQAIWKKEGEKERAPQETAYRSPVRDDLFADLEALDQLVWQQTRDDLVDDVAFLLQLRFALKVDLFQMEHRDANHGQSGDSKGWIQPRHGVAQRLLAQVFAQQWNVRQGREHNVERHVHQRDASRQPRIAEMHVLEQRRPEHAHEHDKRNRATVVAERGLQQQQRAVPVEQHDDFGSKQPPGAQAAQDHHV